MTSTGNITRDPLRKNTMVLYVLASKTKTTNQWRTYVGVTKDMPTRLSQHNGCTKGGAKFTRGGDWKLVCCMGGFKTDRLARQCEYVLKHTDWGIRNEHPIRRKILQVKELLIRGKLPRSTQFFRDQGKFFIHWNEQFRSRYMCQLYWPSTVEHINISQTKSPKEESKREVINLVDHDDGDDDDDEDEEWI